MHETPEQGQVGVISGQGRIGDRNQLSIGPSTYTIWCADGCGRAMYCIPSVANFSRTAQNELDAYGGSANTDMAEACASLGHVLGFTRDTAKYGKYLKLSDSFLTSCIEQASTDVLPSRLAELGYQRDTTVHVQVFSGDLGTPDVDGMANRRQHPPHLHLRPLLLLFVYHIKLALNEGDIYRYVVQHELFALHSEYSFRSAAGKNWTMYAEVTGRDSDPCTPTLNPSDQKAIKPHVIQPGANELRTYLLSPFLLGDHDVATPIRASLVNNAAACSNVCRQEMFRSDSSIGTVLLRQWSRYYHVNRCVSVSLRHIAHGFLGSLAAIDDSRA
ncbi:unnamed protein product [Ectocarpus sp. 4 AP-2014]